MISLPHTKSSTHPQWNSGEKLRSARTAESERCHVGKISWISVSYGVWKHGCGDTTHTQHICSTVSGSSPNVTQCDVSLDDSHPHQIAKIVKNRGARVTCPTSHFSSTAQHGIHHCHHTLLVHSFLPSSLSSFLHLFRSSTLLVRTTWWDWPSVQRLHRQWWRQSRYWALRSRRFDPRRDTSTRTYWSTTQRNDNTSAQ